MINCIIDFMFVFRRLHWLYLGLVHHFMFVFRRLHWLYIGLVQSGACLSDRGLHNSHHLQERPSYSEFHPYRYLTIASFRKISNSAQCGIIIIIIIIIYSLMYTKLLKQFFHAH